MNYHEILFFVMAILGMISHYLKKYAKKETTVSIYEWFGASNLPGSVASIGTLIFTVSSAIASGVITPDMSIWAIVYAGMTTGIAVDSTTNSDGAVKEEPKADQ